MTNRISIDRLLTAIHVVTEYLEDEVPPVPEAPQNNIARRQVLIQLASVKESIEEIFTQLEEIRSARASYQSVYDNLEGAERTVLGNLYREEIDGNALNILTRQGNSRLKKLKELRRKIEMKLNDQDAPIAGAQGPNMRNNTALPKISLKEFDGQSRGWTDFWPLFESLVDKDHSLDAVQKMSYLDSVLHGEAKKVIEGLLPFSEDNYRLALELLKEKYGKDENIIRNLHLRLSGLKKSQTIDLVLQIELERICRQLENYGQDISHPQIYLMLEQKLSKRVCQKYVDIKELSGEDNWSTDLFRKTFAKTLDQIKKAKEIYEKGESSQGQKEKKERKYDEKKRDKERENDSTMNFAIKIDDRKDRNPQRGSRYRYSSNSTDLEHRRRTEYRNPRKSEYRKSNHYNPREARSGSPWPKLGKERYSSSSLSTSRSGSRSPSRFPCAFCGGKHHPSD